MYDSLGELSKEGLEVEGVASVGISDFFDDSVDELVPVEAEGLGGHQDVPDVGSPLPRIRIQREHGVQFRNRVSGKDRIFASNVLGHHGS